jgi:hypothetical protein
VAAKIPPPLSSSSSPAAPLSRRSKALRSPLQTIVKIKSAKQLPHHYHITRNCRYEWQLMDESYAMVSQGFQMQQNSWHDAQHTHLFHLLRYAQAAVFERFTYRLNLPMRIT